LLSDFLHELRWKVPKSLANTIILAAICNPVLSKVVISVGPVFIFPMLPAENDAVLKRLSLSTSCRSMASAIIPFLSGYI
jgi:hypothetical protein